MTLARVGRKSFALIAFGALLAVSLVVLEGVRTAPIRGSMRTASKLVAAANRGHLEGARALCTPGFLRASPLAAGRHGGISGLPRSIDRSFRAWREGEAVLVCLTGREGFVYRFLPHEGIWKFDGPVGTIDRHGNLFGDLPQE